MSEESKLSKETVEEAAESNCTSSMYPYRNYEKSMFIKGAKWQKERMYSEDEVKLILDKVLIEHSDIVLVDIPSWFNKFKKK